MTGFLQASSNFKRIPAWVGIGCDKKKADRQRGQPFARFH